jgi:hypothetical protein
MSSIIRVYSNEYDHWTCLIKVQCDHKFFSMPWELKLEHFRNFNIEKDHIIEINNEYYIKFFYCRTISYPGELTEAYMCAIDFANTLQFIENIEGYEYPNDKIKKKNMIIDKLRNVFKNKKTEEELDKIFERAKNLLIKYTKYKILNKSKYSKDELFQLINRDIGTEILIKDYEYVYKHGIDYRTEF